MAENQVHPAQLNLSVPSKSKVPGALRLSSLRGSAFRPSVLKPSALRPTQITNATTMNLFTLLYLMNFIPVVILGMVYHNCNVDNGECDDFLHIFKLFTPVRIFCLLFLSLVVLKRLSSIDLIP